MKTKIFTLCISAILLLSSCATYRAVSLPILSPEFAPFSQEQNGVTVSCKAFTKADSKRYLGRDVISKGYQPLHLSVQNETNRYLLFSAQGISLPVVPPDEVASKVHTSTAGRATAYGVAGLFIWPLLIPAVVDGVGSSQANQQLDADFSAKGASEQIVQPYGTLNKILFVPTSDYNNSFTVTLVDKETKENIRFNITVNR